MNQETLKTDQMIYLNHRSAFAEQSTANQRGGEYRDPRPERNRLSGTERKLTRQRRRPGLDEHLELIGNEAVNESSE